MIQDEKLKKITTIKSFGIFYAYFMVITHWKSFCALLKYLKTVLTKFFGIQFLVKFKLKKIPVISVDNELDELVPFVPAKVDTYLDFINFWVRPMALLGKLLGGKKGSLYAAEYLTLIEKTYSQAACIYQFRMTTTHRPLGDVGKYNKDFWPIRNLDPHFLCVPSLHVAVVTLAYVFFKDVFKKEGLSQEYYERFTQELYDGAVEIIETVLYVKQHSVNCIPAALYMMTNILKEKFTVKNGVDVIDSLFVSATDVKEADKKAIHEYIHFFFEKLVLEGCNEEDWTVPVKRWLLLQEKNATN
ncbi:MAG: hypothetical protein E7062_08395 [Spirochaetaceae bacterium]|nr:hypothetical protein [Spirochaetaceae bacterium]